METERLILRNYKEKDHTDFIELFTDEIVMKFVDTGVYTLEKAEKLWQKLTKEFYPNGINTIYAVILKSEEKFLGNCSIRPRSTNQDEWEIGYVLKTESWGKGYATEIAGKLIDFGFNELNLITVFATVDTDNYSSIRVLEKVGMRHIRDEYDEQGKFFVYGIEKPVENQQA